MADETVGSNLETFFQFVYYLFLPLILLTGVLCFVRSLLKATKYYEGKETLDGKTIVITGGSSGLGRALALELRRRGARIISACRTQTRRDSTAVYLREKSGSFDIRVMYMDLNNLDSVREFALDLIESEERIDCLINNAGRLCGYDFTADGIDRMMGINYVGHLLLTSLLAEKIRTTPKSLGRIITITGGSFTNGSLEDLRDLENKKKTSYDLRRVYRSSKLGLYLMNRELARRYTPFEICSLCVDPGLMNTDFYQNLPSPQNQYWSLIAKCFFRSPEEGMQSVLHALFLREFENSSGMVVKDCELYAPNDCNWTESVITDIWDQTLQLVQSKDIRLTPDKETLDAEKIECFARLQATLAMNNEALNDDEEVDNSSSREYRPATPPRSNKTLEDEGDEIVDLVEFEAEEPPSTVRTSPSRQSSFEKTDDHHKEKATVLKSSFAVKADSVDEEEIPETVHETASQLEETEENTDLPDHSVDNKNIVEGLASDIEKIQELLQEEETEDLRRVELILSRDGTSVDDEPDYPEEEDDFDNEVRDFGESMRQENNETQSLIVEPSESQVVPSIDAAAEEETLNTDQQADANKSLAFDYSHNLRNNHVVSSLGDVKGRRLLLYPARKRISLS